MLRSLLTTIVLAVLAIVLVLVGVRFLALLVGANQDSELVQKVYDWSEFWVEPFFNVFDLENKSVEGGGTFEPASLIAFVFYLLVGVFVMALLRGPSFLRPHHA